MMTERLLEPQRLEGIRPRRSQGRQIRRDENQHGRYRLRKHQSEPEQPVHFDHDASVL